MITTTDIEWIFRQIAPFMTSHFQMLMTLQFCRVKIPITNFHNYYTIWWELLKQHTRRIDIQHITREVKTQNTCRPAFPPRHWWPRKPMEEGTNTYPGTHQQPPTHSSANYVRPPKANKTYALLLLLHFNQNCLFAGWSHKARNIWSNDRYMAI